MPATKRQRQRPRRNNNSDVRSPSSTSSEVRSPTSTSTEVRSPTSTSTEVRSPTSTSTEAYTAGNVTVTGGAGAGATTTVKIRRNPDYDYDPDIDEAPGMSEAFHGRPVDELIEIRTKIVEHEHLAPAGLLLKIELTNGNDIEFETDYDDDLTYLCLNGEGTQMYVEGGDQSIDLEAFDVDPTKEHIMLGKVKRLFYSTDKQHLGKADKVHGPYKHKVGEESGDMPYLLYDRLSELLSFAGGSYYVPIDIKGKYSSGIHD